MLHRQSTEEGYDHFTDEVLKKAELSRLRAADMRKSVEQLIEESVKSLKTLADAVTAALDANIDMTQSLVENLELDLRRVFFTVFFKTIISLAMLNILKFFSASKSLLKSKPLLRK